MLDLTMLKRMRVYTKPLAQRLVADLMLMPNYGFLPGVDIRIEGFDKVPEAPVIYAMNHTDRFNYWPFQYQLRRKHSRYTAVWVKGKYYEHPVLGRFMEWVNSVPAVSRGYLIVKDFIRTVGRKPSDDEYRVLRDWVDSCSTSEATKEQVDRDLSGVPTEILNQPRDILGRPFDPSTEDYAIAQNRLFEMMMHRVLELNQSVVDKKLDLIIFPQGTRSLRLSRGQIGLAQIALYFGLAIVPVGCNGSDKVYPGGSPLARKGQVVYRCGEPITPEQLAEYMPPQQWSPFNSADEQKHRPLFRALTDRVMDSINSLLDEEYQIDKDKGDGVQGSSRFV